MKVTQITWAVFHVFWNNTTALCDKQTETYIIYSEKTLGIQCMLLLWSFCLKSHFVVYRRNKIKVWNEFHFLNELSISKQNVTNLSIMQDRYKEIKNCLWELHIIWIYRSVSKRKGGSVSVLAVPYHCASLWFLTGASGQSRRLGARQWLCITLLERNIDELRWNRPMIA